MNSDRLIHELAGDLKPVRRSYSIWSVLVLWTVLSVVWAVLTGWMYGIFEFTEEGMIARFSFHYDSFWSLVAAIAGVAVAFLSAAGAYMLSIPGRRSKPARTAGIVLLVLWALLLFYGLALELSGSFRSEHVAVFPCFGSVFLFALGPSVLLIFLLRKNFVTNPLRTGIFSALAGLAVGTVCVSVYCPDSRASHGMVSHFTALLAFPLLGLLFAKFLDTPSQPLHKDDEL